MYRILMFVGLCLLSFTSIAQISTPAKRKFNLGIYGGLSVWKLRPMVSVDLSYKGTTLRLMPNYNYYAVGLTQELTKLSPVFYNLYWTGSIYGGYSVETYAYNSVAPGEFDRNTYTVIAATGLKTYFSKKLYTHLMAGVMYNQPRTKGFTGDDKSEYFPYFEFGLGLNFFKTYPALKREETEE